MKPSTIQDYQRSHIIEQLAKHDFYDVDGLSYDQLKYKLATIRALQVDNEAPANKFF